MITSWRLLACVAALNLFLTAAASAQTVIVRKAPRGAAIELVVNATTVTSVTASPEGEATLPVDIAKNGGKPKIDAYMFVDVCDQSRRVVIIERGVTPPSQGACVRTAIPGLFLLQPVTTMVVDASENGPTMHLRQGRVPASWMRDEVPGQPKVRRQAPKGFVFSGGLGWSSVAKAVDVSCGTVTNCSGDNAGFTPGVGVGVWVTRFLAAEVAYIKPPDATTSGSGTSFKFDSRLVTDVATITAKVAAPVGPVRIYALVGPSVHRATLTTSETFDDVAITNGDVTTTVKGGTQTFELKTRGWSWTFGGGLEAWVTGKVAIFAEFNRAGIKGDRRGGGEGSIDDHLNAMLFGARFHLGPRRR